MKITEFAQWYEKYKHGSTYLYIESVRLVHFPEPQKTYLGMANFGFDVQRTEFFDNRQLYICKDSTGRLNNRHGMFLRDKKTGLFTYKISNTAQNKRIDITNLSDELDLIIWESEYKNLCGALTNTFESTDRNAEKLRIHYYSEAFAIDTSTPEAQKDTTDIVDYGLDLLWKCTLLKNKQNEKEQARAKFRQKQI